jgi:hypothetical protein
MQIQTIRLAGNGSGERRSTATIAHAISPATNVASAKKPPS